jgi:hypothetical protein
MAQFNLKYQDTLISQSRIWLFGRPMADITINTKVYEFIRVQKNAKRTEQPPVAGSNNFLLNQLIKNQDQDPKLARIYGYAYEGCYCDLPRPALFLVHGEGEEADVPSDRFDPNLVLLGRAPANIGRLGVATATGSFATGMKVWAYDRADFTIRLDAETGSFESLLLEPDDDGSDPGPGMQSYGSRVRAGASRVRAAGALARPRRRNRNGE